jgi:hypothetical protein
MDHSTGFFTDKSTGFFLDDDELFALFARDDNPPLIKSRLFRINASSSIVELQGMKGNILAVRKLRQPSNTVQVKLNSGSMREIEGRLQELGFSRSQSSGPSGFSDWKEELQPPAGYTLYCDRIRTIWRFWWPVKNRTLNGRTAVIFFHEGKWLDIEEVQSGQQPMIVIKTRHQISTNAEVTWAIDSRFAKGTKVEERIKIAPTGYVDARAWANESAITGARTTLDQVLKEVSKTSQKWIVNVKSIDADISGLLDESSAIDQRKKQLLQALEHLAKIAQQRS